MARYIDAELALKIIDSYAKTVTADGKVVVDAIRDIVEVITPTADVVPKSKVERLQEEANRYKRYYFRHDYDEMIAEVLDKLDRFINANCIAIKDERGIKGYVTSGVHFAIAEHKKKYTED